MLVALINDHNGPIETCAGCLHLVLLVAKCCFVKPPLKQMRTLQEDPVKRKPYNKHTILGAHQVIIAVIQLVH